MATARDEAVERLTKAAEVRYEGPTEVRCSDVLLVLKDSKHPRAKELCFGAQNSITRLITKMRGEDRREASIAIACREYTVNQLAEQLRESLRSVGVTTKAPPKPAQPAAVPTDLIAFMAFDEDEPAVEATVEAAAEPEDEQAASALTIIDNE